LDEPISFDFKQMCFANYSILKIIDFLALLRIQSFGSLPIKALVAFSVEQKLIGFTQFYASQI